MASAPARARVAIQPLVRFSTLWFQITGLRCNLECTHCLVDSSPGNHSLRFLERDEVRRHLAEADSLGVKEVYFTGGEPFLHRDMTDILADSLAVAPSTVLTNGTLITERLARTLGELADASRYSLEIRVSLDHPDPETNDRVRGEGVHAKAVRAVLRLQEAGLLPIVTATEFVLEPRAAGEEGAVYESFYHLLRKAGVRRPRLKILPVFATGKLAGSAPACGGAVTPAMLEGADPLLLQCAEARLVAADGVYACPILVGKPEGLMTRDGLAASLGGVPLAHSACLTCVNTGMSCSNL